jgi:hypothetical protein
MRDAFQDIHSIEVQPDLARIACQRFKKLRHVTIHTGDSSSVLPIIQNKIKGTTLYWLDGHYSAGITGRGAKDCPIYEELEAIAALPPARFSIVIDDHRCFGSDPAYPTYVELLDQLTGLFPDHDVNVELDMVWCRAK